MFDIQIAQHYVVKLHNGFLKNTLVQILTRVLAKPLVLLYPDDDWNIVET
jgi:hypothetical protein